MNTSIKNQIISLAKLTPDREICGFIYYTKENKLKIFPGNNISVDPCRDFEIDPTEYIACHRLGVICGVYHSHVREEDGDAFSPCDLDYVEEIAVPLYLYSVTKDSWKEYIPETYDFELTRRPFIWGLYDCFSALRDGWRQRRKIYIDDYDRDESFPVNQSSKHAILDNIERFGGVVIGRGKKDLHKLEIDDAILFNTSSRSRILPFHLGLFIGDSNFFHHPEDQLSCVDHLDGNWINRINLIVRHKSLVNSSEIMCNNTLNKEIKGLEKD